MIWDMDEIPLSLLFRLSPSSPGLSSLERCSVPSASLWPFLGLSGYDALGTYIKFFLAWIHVF